MFEDLIAVKRVCFERSLSYMFRRKAKEGLSKEEQRGPYVREYVRDFVRPEQNYADSGVAGDAVEAAEMCREKEEKARKVGCQLLDRF